MAAPVHFDSRIGAEFLRYARLVANRGYIHEVRRNIEAERLAAIKGTTPLYRSEAEITLMHKHAEAIIYPTRAEKVMQEEQAAA
jgi:hypothetical protein